MNIFEYAAREKLRFPYKGMVSAEDLWDLSITQLNTVYKALNAEKKTVEEESLLDKHTKEDDELLTKIEIVKYVFQAKQAEAEARTQAAANEERKRRIRELIADKEDQALSAQSIEDLKKMLAEMS